MMKYYNVSMIAKGKKQQTLIKAENKKSAIEKAKLKHYGIILKVEETSPPLEVRLQEFKEFLGNLKKGKVNRRKYIAAIRQLAVMTNAGIALHDALTEIANNTDDIQLKQIFSDLSESINAGKSLTQSLEPYRYQVGSLTITMTKLGEKTGDISSAFFTLANILEQIDENIAKFKKAIRYPLITLTAMAIAFTILISFVVPKFKTIFEKLHAELPLPTKILLFLEKMINTYGLYVLGALIVGIITFIYFYRHNKEFKYNVDRAFLHIYLLKDIIYYAQLNRFFLVFSELLKAGIPVVDALQDSVALVENSYIKDKLIIVKEMVEKGSSIADAFKDTGLFENMILQMIEAGEASGQLDAMLAKITEYYGMKFDYILDNMSSYIEPIMIAIIAALVLLLALGIFLPMWDMAKAVRQAG